MARPGVLPTARGIARFRLLIGFIGIGLAATASPAIADVTVIHSWDFDTNPGWMTSGQWAFGAPNGSGGTYHGYPDPANAHTGANVYGVNLNGDYSTTVGGPHYLTTGPIDCTGHFAVALRYYRWLNTDYPPYVYATIEVSNNGMDWTSVWSNASQGTITDNAWTLCSYNLGTTADNQPTVYIRWGYKVGSYAWAYSGWNIDDVQVVSVEPVELTMAASPADGGVTTPTVGGPYLYAPDTLVDIVATPSPGYRFDHWTVSGGSQVADPASASTTVTMDVSKTVTAVFVAGPPVNLSMAVSPPGTGTTEPAEGGPYSILLNDVVSISATPGPGYRFDHWMVSAGLEPDNPTSSSTTIRMDQDKTVTAVFMAVELTMAASPASAGFTAPAVGGPYPTMLNEVVSIIATPTAVGYQFDHWTVSAGSPVASPTSPSTTVTMDQSKTVTAVFVGPQFRGVWVDAFHPGFKSAAEVDDLVMRVSNARMNAIVAEVLAYQDNAGGGHGAYWQSDIVPLAAEVASGFDALAYLVSAAHAHSIEVHAWLVTYRVSASWPPSGNTILASHPEYLMVPSSAMGSIGTVGGKFVLDPGSPDVQEYLVSIVRELATRYEIDGIHWDYVRYETTDAGYPTDLNYPRSGLARFRQITGYAGTPPSVGEPLWDDFRRQEITELVRRVQAELPTIAANPRQPLRHTAALIPWGDAPSDFTQSSAYRSCYQDWRFWMEQGYLDAGCPMFYDREHCADQAQWYRNWVDAAIGWRYSRHLFSGQASYLNSMANSITQMQYAYDQGVDGSMNYSYYGTRANETFCDGSDGWSNDWNWYSYLADNLFFRAVPAPSMPWRNPATATEGTLYGRVTHSVTGDPIDDVTIQVGSLDSVKTDGNGYYVVTLIPATASGTDYVVTATYEAESLTHNNVHVVAGSVRRNDFAVGPLQPPTIVQDPAGQDLCEGETAVFSVVIQAEGDISYQWQKNEVDLVDGDRHAGSTTDTLTISAVEPGDVGDYRCAVSNAAGTVSSQSASLTIQEAPLITQEPSPQAVHLHATAFFSIEASGSGLTYQWQREGVDLVNGANIQGARTATLQILDVQLGDRGAYRCVVAGDCGTVVSEAALLTITTVPADFDFDGDVDQIDFGILQRCFSGDSKAQNEPGCQAAKLDGDQDVDPADFALFVQCMSGPDVTADMDCFE